MRNIFHEILARYLDSDQHGFDTTPRELWPSERFEYQLHIGHGAAGLAAESTKRRAARSELEPQN
jgi:hypothetical protein